MGGRGLSIESRHFLRNICHFQSNLPFKSDFESHFTFKNLSLNSPEMEGGGGVLRPESRLLVEGPAGRTESRLHTLESRNGQKGGGVEKSGLIQTFSEENIIPLHKIINALNHIKISALSGLSEHYFSFRC